MFTPPPSPLPKERVIDSISSDTAAASSGGTQALGPPLKLRRRRYIALLIPVIVLIAIALSIRHEALFAFSSRLPIVEPLVAHLGADVVGADYGHLHHRAAHHLPHRRQADISIGSSAPATMTPTPTVTSVSETFGGSPTSQTLIYTPAPSVVSPALPVPTPFPAAFDISLSFNITTPSCIAFFNTFTQNVTFRACRPFSLLTSSSQQFQIDQQNLTTLTAVMGGTCNTDMSEDECADVMDWHAEQIVKDENCGEDIDAQEALAVTALTGFRSYTMMRQAGCILNSLTQAYCYVEAVASLLPNDLYFWNIASGIPLPNSTAPTCSTCTGDLLATYALYAGNKSLPVSETYEFAAQKARDTCGTNYAKDISALTGSAMDAPRLTGSVVLMGAVALGLVLVWS